MLQLTSQNKKAILLLHEIYGVNPFIVDEAKKYHAMGFDIFCPEPMGKGVVFSYEETEKAYRSYYEKPGLDISIYMGLLDELALHYETILVMGFSVGATAGWRLAATGKIQGAIAVYGSRIRDYLVETPLCPSLLLFAEEKVFDVTSIVEVVNKLDNTKVEMVQASHGFMDKENNAFSKKKAEDAEKTIQDFLARF